MAIELPHRFKRREILLILAASCFIFVVYRWNPSLSVYTLLAIILSGVNVYVAYRSLFAQRYIGIVASLFVAFSPWYVSPSFSSEKYAIGVFFVTLAVWAWAMQQWIVWGLALGLAIASHPASAILLVPLVGHALIYRARIAGAWKTTIPGTTLAVVVPVIYLAGMSSSYGGAGKWTYTEFLAHLSSVFAPHGSFQWVQPVQLLMIAIYLAAIGAFAYAFRENPRILKPGLASLAISVPCVAVILFNIEAMLATSGVVLVILSIIAILALWPTDERQDRISLLLLWLAPSLLAFSFLGLSIPAAYVFLVPALALLSCRLLDKSVDGQWLDYWWALGLPSNWYFRLGKITILSALGVSLYQTLR